jgi:beta-phosphoglucomutase-like phosphatase (HAD superfamily)
LRALIWDVDGTVAETERDGHRVAFNLAFEALGVAWRWDEATYGSLLHVTGGRERLLHWLEGSIDAPPIAAERGTLAHELHRRKNDCYAQLVAQGRIDARPGVRCLMNACNRLRVAPEGAFGLEDSPNGLGAARAAGIRCGVTRGAYFADAVFEGAAWVCDDLEPSTNSDSQAVCRGVDILAI